MEPTVPEDVDDESVSNNYIRDPHQPRDGCILPPVYLHDRGRVFCRRKTIARDVGPHNSWNRDQVGAAATLLESSSGDVTVWEAER